MKVLLESTGLTRTFKTPDGSMAARLWEGSTPDGVGVHAWIVRVRANQLNDAAQVDNELGEEHRDPSPSIVDYIDQHEP